jgi:ATP-dependent DNA helicase RecG
MPLRTNSDPYPPQHLISKAVLTDTSELHLLVARGENEQIEFKTTTGQRTEAARTVCAMLTCAGGFVLFGVSDEGRIVGQQVTSDTLDAIIRELRKIEPLVPLTPETIRIGQDREVILIRVPKADGPHTFEGRAYVRTGSMTTVMTPEEYQRLLLERVQPFNRWEIQPASGQSFDDLDAEEVIRTIDEAVRRQRLEDPGMRRIEDLLLGMGLLRDGRITNAAVVLFGRRDRLLPLYPQCSLRLARFRGRDMGEFVDNRHEVGNAFDLLIRAQRFMRDHLPVAGRVVPNVYERVDDPLYPPVALREAIANALCHRDYSIPGGSVGIAIFDDRLEISSSGPLRFGLRPNDLLAPHASKPLEPVRRFRLLLARHHREVGARNHQDRRAVRTSRASDARIRGADRRGCRSVHAKLVHPSHPRRARSHRPPARDPVGACR